MSDLSVPPDPLHYPCVCARLYYFPLAALHLSISVSVGTRPRFANSILATFLTAASSIRCRASNLWSAWSADRENPKRPTMVTRKAFSGNVCLLSRVSAKGEGEENQERT
jgi:hypothetical protein